MRKRNPCGMRRRRSESEGTWFADLTGVLARSAAQSLTRSHSQPVTRDKLESSLRLTARETERKIHDCVRCTTVPAYCNRITLLLVAFVRLVALALALGSWLFLMPLLFLLCFCNCAQSCTSRNRTMVQLAIRRKADSLQSNTF